MNLLAFDTSLGHCAVGLMLGDRVVSRVDAMAKGQAEHLMGMLEELLAGEGVGWGDLDRIGVGTGPGNFTGIRISVAAARGLALGLGRPAVGVSSFDATAFGQPACLVALEAPRGQLYVQAFATGVDPAPRLVAADLSDLPAVPQGCAILGSGAERLIEAGFGQPGTALPFAEGLVRAAAAMPQDSPRPAPLYLRPADAAPPRDAPPVVVP